MKKTQTIVQPTADRRVQRTRQLLQDSLRTLILENGYDAITVQHVIDRANVGRATFYAHFQDKEELLLSGFEQLWIHFEQFFANDALPNGDPWHMSLALFQHAQSHRDLYKAMAGKRGAAIVQTHLHKKLSALLQPHLKGQIGKRKQSFPHEVLTHYLVTSLISMLLWWVDNDNAYSAEQMHAFFQRLAQPGVESVVMQSHDTK